MMHCRSVLARATAILGCAGSGAAAAQYTYDATAVAMARAEFIDRMVAEHAFDAIELEMELAAAEIRQPILDAISRPVERVMPWHEYRNIFLTADRIDKGVDFWWAHRDSVARATDRFGVDAEVLVAILGIETLYGQRMGNYRVLDALSTLAFAYPPRAGFFASELEAFLLLAREQSVDLGSALGSYAGAMGAGQFIPSSYRAYAVDGDGDGQRDLWTNWNDILCSIANYFREHGWHRGEEIAVPAARRVGVTAPEPDNRLELGSTIAELRDSYEFQSTRLPGTPASAYALESAAGGPEYWIGYHNLYVITRYNRSIKYAMAALHLSRELRARFDALAEAQR